MLWSILNLISILSSDGCSFTQNFELLSSFSFSVLKGHVVYAVCFGCRLSMLLPDLLTDCFTYSFFCCWWSCPGRGRAVSLPFITVTSPRLVSWLYM